jgi:hypothetical protein
MKKEKLCEISMFALQWNLLNKDTIGTSQKRP